MSVDENQAKHALVSSWFLGPRAENFDVLEKLFRKVLEDQKKARVDLSDDDKDKVFFITDEMKELDIYQQSIFKLTKDISDLSGDLARQSVPFWSPRYNAHMNMDTTMSSIIGCEYSVLEHLNTM